MYHVKYIEINGRTVALIFTRFSYFIHSFYDHYNVTTVLMHTYASPTHTWLNIHALTQSILFQILNQNLLYSTIFLSHFIVVSPLGEIFIVFNFTLAYSNLSLWLKSYIFFFENL